jgi:hypothetical protein
MVKAGYKVFFKENFNGGKIVRYEKSGEWLEIEPGPLKWTVDREQGTGNREQLISEPRNIIGSPIPDKPNHIYWTNAYGGKLDFEWVTDNTRLTKYLIIENFNHLPPLNQELNQNSNDVYLELNLGFEFSERLTVNREQRTIKFKNKEGETLWGFLPLRYWDSGEQRKEGISEFNIATEQYNNTTMSIQVPYKWLKSATYPVYIDTILELQIGAAADDVWSAEGVSFSTTNVNFNAGRNPLGSADLNSVARFTNVTVPRGAKVNNAYLTLQAVGTDSATVLTDLYAEATNTADRITSEADFQSRASTTAVAWDNIESWTADNNYNSPSIATPIQEVIDRAGWSSGNNINIFWINDGTSAADANRLADSYDGDSTNAPKLTIEYWVPRTPVGPSGGGFLMF